jgi:hypothetical protein
MSSESVLNRKIGLFGPIDTIEKVAEILKSTPMSIFYSGEFQLENIDRILRENPESYYFFDLAKYVYQNYNSRNIINNIKKIFENAVALLDTNQILFHTVYLKNNSKKSDKVNGILKELYFDLICAHPGMNIVCTEKKYEESFILGSDDTTDIKNEIERILTLEYATILSDYEIEHRIENDKLYAKIILGKSLEKYPSEEFKYRFFVLKDSKVIYNSATIDINSIVLELNETGAYVVQGYVRVGNYQTFIRSDAAFYFTSFDKRRYESFLSEPLEKIEKLSISKRDGIFQDFLISNLPSSKDFEELITEYGLKKVKTHRDKIHIYSRDFLVHKNFTIIFSGIIKIGTKICFGLSEIENIIGSGIKPNLFDEPGYYSLAYISPKKIHISNDLLGYSQIWYYQKDGAYVVSNRYSLIISALRDLGLNPKFNFSKSKINLSNMSNYVYSQNFTHRMDIQEIFQLPLNKDIVLSSDKISFIPNWMHNTLVLEQPMSYKEYQNMLSDAISEIKENLLSIYNDPRFSYVVVDSTGGLDSRVIYAVISNIPEIKSKILLRTQGKADSSDVVAGTHMNSLFKYRYDDVYEKREVLPFKETDFKFRESNMGMIYSHRINPYRNIDLKCQINGGSGDALCRSQYSRHFIGNVGERSKDVSQMSRFWLSWVSQTKLFGDIETGADSRKILEEEMCSIPVKSPLEKMDRMYMFFRNAYHFNPFTEYQSNIFIWMPLQSKTLILLNHLTHDAFRGIKLETDLIQKANPLLLSIPFENEKDNIEMHRNNTIFGNIAWVESFPTCENTSIDDWLNSKNKKKYLSVGERDSCFSDEHHSHAVLMNNLKFLLTHYSEEYNDNIGIALFHYIEINKENAGRMNILHNKIQSIIDQLSIIGAKPIENTYLDDLENNNH